MPQIPPCSGVFIKIVRGINKQNIIRSEVFGQLNKFRHSPYLKMRHCSELDIPEKAAILHLFCKGLH